VSKQESLNNNPGDEYIYSNSNYNLLAVIVQRVTGLTLAAFTERNIFQPAGMKHTGWRDNYRKVVKDRAIAYSKSGQLYFTNMPNENAYGNGGLLTTAEDLLIWNQYYLGGKFESPSLLPNQTATRPLNNGRRNGYAAGLVTDSINGWKAISHTGATASYRAYLEHFPEAGLSIAWLSNTSAFDNDTFNLSNAVRKIFLPDRRTARSRPANPSSDSVKAVPGDTSAANMESYVGVYYSREAEATYNLVYKSGKLLLEIKPMSTFILTSAPKDVFNFPLGQIAFVRDGQKKVTELKVSISRARNVVFRKQAKESR
jgi:CubicO group peptidase (beta-lactamase class C family)